MMKSKVKFKCKERLEEARPQSKEEDDEEEESSTIWKSW